jgi:ATP-binding cassette, subfamily B, bacterial
MAMGRDPDAVRGARFERSTMRRVWRFARPYRRMLLGFLGVILVSAQLQLVPPFVAKRLFDHTFPQGDSGEVTTLGLILVGVALLDGALELLERWWSSRIGEGLIFDLRTVLFDHVQRMPIAFFTRTQTGSLISRMNNDVIGAQRALTGTLGSVVSNFITVVVTLIAMVALEWRLTLLGLIVLPLFVIPAKRVGRRVQLITRESMQLNASMNTTMTERFNVAGALLVKLFGRPGAETMEFSDRAGRVRDIGIRSAMLTRTFMVALGLVAAMGTAVIYWVGGRMVIDGSISEGTLLALSVLVIRIYTPLTALSNAHVDLLSTLVSFERVFEVLDAPRAIDERPGAVDLVEPSGRVQIEHVSFRYPAADTVSIASLETEGAVVLSSDPSAWILRDVNATIAPGEMVALVGPSGAGKTTLSTLIPRLYDVTEGAIRIDGHDVRDLTFASLSAAIGVVTQDAHLFHDTIGANLRYAKPDASDSEIVAACKAARIHDVIAALPDGYDTTVGERGYRLSGGEKQRLAIARVLLKAPAIVILDEATAHLDSETEVLIQQALDEALAGRTSLVIAHRLSTIQAADQILVLDEGKVVERGTHAALLGAGGLYSELYETQFNRGGSPAPVDEALGTASLHP